MGRDPQPAYAGEPEPTGGQPGGGNGVAPGDVAAEPIDGLQVTPAVVEPGDAGGDRQAQHGGGEQAAGEQVGQAEDGAAGDEGDDGAQPLLPVAGVPVV